MTPRPAGYAMLLSLLLALGPAAAGALAASRPFEELLPEDTSLFLTLRSVSGASDWLERSPLAEIRKSRELESFSRKLTDLLERELAGRGNELRGVVADLKDICRGEVALALGDTASFLPPAKEPRFAVLVDIGSERQKARDLIEKLLERWRAQETLRRRESEFRGERIVTLEPKDRAEVEEGDEPGSPAFSFVLADDLFVLATSRPYLESILARRGDSSAPSLSGRSDFREVRDGHFRSSALLLYIDVRALLEMAMAQEKATGQGAAEAERVEKVLEMLGISGIRAFAASVELEPLALGGSSYVLAPGTPRGLLKAVWTKPERLRFPAVIPDDAASATVLQVDFAAVYEMILDLVRYSAAQEVAEGGAPRDPVGFFEQQLGISFKDDLVASLGGQLVEFQRVRKPFSEESVEAAFLIELKDRERFQTAIDKILGLAPVFRKGSYLGRPLYTFGLFGAPSDEESEEELGLPALGIADTYFVIGLSRGVVEEVIRRVGKDVKSLADAPGFKDVADAYPSSAITIGYQSPETFEYLLYMMKDLSEAFGLDLGDLEGEPAEAGELEPDDGLEIGRGAPPIRKAGGEGGIRDLLDALPEPEFFTRRLAGIVSHGFVDERGLGVRGRIIFKRRGGDSP